MEASEHRVGWVPAPRQGWVAPHVAAELPGLGLAWTEVECRPGRSPEGIRRRLRDLSDRFYGSHAVQMRQKAIPWAYRTFFRQIGLDPDHDRTPVEQLALERLFDGGFKPRGIPRDALTIAIVETGVALRAFDADALQGPLCIRDSAPGEGLVGTAGELAQGTLVVADDEGPVAVLFGPRAEGRAVGKDCRRVAVVATQVQGVPQIAVEEALWMASVALEKG
ncbi:MAG TPA: phenylalanine--tRNA ligase beta subunit-related protein [Solirubrobacterales bacterium]|jgi:DNA/RNA-binding domain of Phe-tRNA-synthetase-like protein